MNLRGLNYWWVFLVVASLAIMISVAVRNTPETSVNIGRFEQELKAGHVTAITLMPEGATTEARATLKDPWCWKRAGLRWAP